MRILHASDCYLPRSGGIELHVHDLANRQRARGDVVEIATTTIAPNGYDDAGLVMRAPAHRSGRPTHAAQDMVEDTLDAFHPDAVHSHLSVYSPFAAAVARRAVAHGIPTLVTVHSLWNDPVLAVVLRTAMGLGSLPVQWSAVSAVAADRVRRTLGEATNVLTLPNAVERSVWMPDEWPAPSRSDDPLTIVSVMRLARRKRPLPFARILRRVRAAVPTDRPIRAVIIGDGPQRDQLRAYLQHHRMDQWVELPGQLDRSEIRAQFARTAVYCAPAELESFGIAALEARCAGLPVVASRRGGVGTFLTDDVDGVLTADDSAMTAALVRLVVDDEYRQKLAANARRSIPEVEWDAVVANTSRAYMSADRLLRHNPAGTRAVLL